MSEFFIMQYKSVSLQCAILKFCETRRAWACVCFKSYLDYFSESIFVVVTLVMINCCIFQTNFDDGSASW